MSRLDGLGERVHPRHWLPVVVLVVLLGLLWTWGTHRWPYLLPPLGQVWTQLHTHAGYFASNAWATLSEALLGLLVGFVAAFVLAVLVSEVPLARRAIMPVAVVLNVTPLVAIAPALVVAFGFGIGPKVIVTALICFFPILINTAAGLRTVPREVLQVYRTVHASRLEILRHLRVPSALPYVFAALQIVFPLSIVGAVVAEISAAGAAKGLGTVIQQASSMSQLAVEWAAIAVLALLGAVLLGVITLIRRWALRWARES
jgi:NitT/TauT family transport system permease protein